MVKEGLVRKRKKDACERREKNVEFPENTITHLPSLGKGKKNGIAAALGLAGKGRGKGGGLGGSHLLETSIQEVDATVQKILRAQKKKKKKNTNQTKKNNHPPLCRSRKESGATSV